MTDIVVSETKTEKSVEPVESKKETKTKKPKIKRLYLKGVLPERFLRHYQKITSWHRFGVKQVYIEYVEACAAAYEEAKQEDLVKNEDGKKKEEQVQEPIQRCDSL